PGTMAAVAAPAADVRAVLEEIGVAGEVIVANDNAPAQAVVSGPTSAVERAVAALTDRGLKARPVPVAAAFHSPLVASAADSLAAELARVDVGPAAHPVWSNGTAAPYPDAPERVRALLARQVAEPVRFVEQIEAMYAAGARVFVEAGPGRVLTGLVRKILGDRPHTVVACDVSGENGVTRLLNALAGLAVAGVPVDFGPLFAGRAQPAVPALPTAGRSKAARRPGWVVNGHLVRTSAGECVAGGLRPATEAPRVDLTPTGETMADGTGTQRDAAVMEFLRTTRELVAAQRDVLLGYLGTAPAPALVPVTLQPAPAALLAPEPAVLAAPGASAPPPPPEEPEAKVFGPEEIREVVLATVSARTGYPSDMLGTDLDLEGDLSIDSIKRTEIIGELAEQLGLGGDEADLEDAVTELARIKTIGGIADWLGGHLTGPAEPAATAPAAAPAAEPAAVAVPASGPPGRFVVETVSVPAPEGEGDALTGRRVVIVDDGRGVALELADLLERRGAEARVVEAPPEDETAADALVQLAALRPGTRPVLPAAFAGIRHAVLGGADRVVVATTSAGAFGPTEGADAADAGLRGLVRALAHEYPGSVTRAVDVDPK
ncbi:MAG: acyltransferase domain-containing protein, partial [Actinoallomurus sp.]